MTDPLDETTSTYASEGPSGVFGPAANGRHQLLSPFAVPSWEPRFAIDHLSVDAGALAAVLAGGGPRQNGGGQTKYLQSRVKYR